MSTQQLIIIAEDHEQTANDYRALISRGMDIRIEIASDGAKALELARNLSPDLVLLDIDLPVMNGFEVLEELKRRNIATRVFMVSGYYVDTDTAIRAIKAGACDYLTKPVHPVTLVDRIKKALVTSATLNTSMQDLVAPYVLELFKSVERASAHKAHRTAPDNGSDTGVSSEPYRPTLRQRLENNILAISAAAFVAGVMMTLAFLQVILPARQSPTGDDKEKEPPTTASPVVRAQVATPASHAPASQSSTPAGVSSELGMTIEEFHDKNDSLRSRFAEMNYFLAGAVGKRVDWTVRVAGVTQIDDRIHVSFYPPGERSRQIGGATFEERLKTRLMALGEGDLIKIQGTITMASGGEVSINGSDFQFVRSASPSP